MATIRVATVATITLLSFHLFQMVGIAANSKGGVYAVSADNSGLIGAPVMYRDTMLIVVTDEGVAAIVFQEKDAKLVNQSAKYRFRFLKDSNSEEVTGTGIVLDSSNKEELTVKAGPIRVGWSGSSHARGWIYYQPEEMQICIASANRFDDSFTEEAPGVKHPVQKLDLKRFVKKQKG
jgi:hypothetical protein